MAINPKSLENLQRGNTTGARKKATKSFIEHLVKELEKRLPEALDALDQLPPKEYIAAYTKLLDRFMPKPEQEKEEGEQRALTFITQLMGNEKPAPLLDLSQLQLDENNDLSSAELIAISPLNTEDNEGIIEI